MVSSFVHSTHAFSEHHRSNTHFIEFISFDNIYWKWHVNLTYCFFVSVSIFLTQRCVQYYLGQFEGPFSAINLYDSYNVHTKCLCVCVFFRRFPILLALSNEFDVSSHVIYDLFDFFPSNIYDKNSLHAHILFPPSFRVHSHPHPHSHKSLNFSRILQIHLCFAHSI